MGRARRRAGCSRRSDLGRCHCGRRGRCALPSRIIASHASVLIALANRSRAVLQPTTTGDRQHVNHQVLVGLVQDPAGPSFGRRRRWRARCAPPLVTMGICQRVAYPPDPLRLLRSVSRGVRLRRPRPRGQSSTIRRRGRSWSSAVVRGPASHGHVRLRSPTRCR